MIVWGGEDDTFLNTGGRYNPSTDSWVATSTSNAPEARAWHTAVWTGSNEMIVWGGYGGGPNELNTGGRYHPGTDTWTVTSTINAPIAREGHTAVWTGTEMLVWGGVTGQSPPFSDDGGRVRSCHRQLDARQLRQYARLPGSGTRQYGLALK